MLKRPALFLLIAAICLIAAPFILPALNAAPNTVNRVLVWGLFGLGFDTATEVGLLVLAGGAAALSLPWYAVLTLPILFAAGMSLLDSADGLLMRYAYGWAFARPVRKVFYNITITSVSIEP